jgi:hypothetical protein
MNIPEAFNLAYLQTYGLALMLHWCQAEFPESGTQWRHMAPSRPLRTFDCRLDGANSNFTNVEVNEFLTAYDGEDTFQIS